MRLSITLLCFVLIAVSCAFAGPVQPGDIDAEAVWYGHIDMEAIMQQPLIKEMHKTSMKKGSKNPFKKAFKNMCMNLMGGFLSATIYATQYEGEFGVVLMKFRSDLPQENLKAVFAQRFPEHQETLIGKRRVFTWRMRCGRRKKVLSGCFVNARQILIGMDIRHVENALDVLDGSRMAMTSDNPLFKGVTPGILCVSRALEVPASYQLSTYCPVLRHCREAFARWTCLDDTMRGRYEFQATDVQKAALYNQAIEGMKAMFALRFCDYDEVMPLLEGFTNVQIGKALILTWEGSPQQLKKAFNQIRQRRRLMRKVRREYNKK